MRAYARSVQRAARESHRPGRGGGWTAGRVSVDPPPPTGDHAPPMHPRRHPATARAAVLARLGLALGALVVALLLAELVVRALEPAPGSAASPFHVGGAAGAHELTVPDRDLLYRLAPDSGFLGYYRIGPRGWRGDAELPDAPADDVLRIVCTGDSTTFGMGVREDRAWPAVLQRPCQLEPVEITATGRPIAGGRSCRTPRRTGRSRSQ